MSPTIGSSTGIVAAALTTVFGLIANTAMAQSIRSYVTRDGHLFLSLMADGGIYEFEPVPRTRR